MSPWLRVALSIDKKCGRLTTFIYTSKLTPCQLIKVSVLLKHWISACLVDSKSNPSNWKSVSMKVIFYCILLALPICHSPRAIDSNRLGGSPGACSVPRLIISFTSGISRPGRHSEAAAPPDELQGRWHAQLFNFQEIKSGMGVWTQVRI